MINEIERYCNENAITSGWYGSLKKIKNMIDEVEIKETFTKNDHKRIEEKVVTLCKYSDTIFEHEHFPDWFEYYVEIQLSIFYYMLEESDNSYNLDRVLRAKKETSFNESTVLKSLNK